MRSIGGAAGDVDDHDVILLDRHEHLAGRVADRDPMGGGADVDLLHLVGGGIDHQHGVAELARRPDHARGIDHHAMRRVHLAEIDDARERLRGQVDHHDAPVRVDPLHEDSVAIDRAVGGAAIRRQRDLVGRARHVDRRRGGERRGVDEMHLVGGLGGDDEVRTAGTVVGVDHALLHPSIVMGGLSILLAK